MSESAVPMDKIKASMRATWMAGDYGVVAKMVADGAEAFVRRLGPVSGQRVLDVACGTGNLAIPLARAGAVVTGVDIAPNLLEQAHARAVAEGLTVQFDEGDAEAMPYADGSFDIVVTMFGTMFAPRPEVVASELARVLKAGGKLAMANWDPEGFTGKMFRLGSQHVPPPAGVAPPVLWGKDDVVRERLMPYFDRIETTLTPIDLDLLTDAAGIVQFFRKYFGPTQMAFDKLDAGGQAAFAKDLEALWGSANVAADPQSRTLVKSQYMEVTAVKR